MSLINYIKEKVFDDGLTETRLISPFMERRLRRTLGSSHFLKTKPRLTRPMHSNQQVHRLLAQCKVVLVEGLTKNGFQEDVVRFANGYSIRGVEAFHFLWLLDPYFSDGSSKESQNSVTSPRCWRRVISREQGGRGVEILWAI